MMDLTHFAPAARATSALAIFDHSRRTWLTSALGIGLLAVTVTAQRPAPYGKESVPEPAPVGYPKDLAAIPAGFVRVGIEAKEVQAIAKESSHGQQQTHERLLRLLVRELGKQEVMVPAFLIGRHEVTNEQYEAFVKANWPKVRFPFDWWLESDIRKHREEYYKKNKGKRGASFKPQDYWAHNFPELKWKVPAGREKFPVTYVSYREAQAYCAWAGLRLPYEPEWQLALQGAGKKPTRYILGKKWDNEWLQELALKSLRDAKKREVMAAPGIRTCYGIDDMLGNVWEWTQSPFLEFDDFDKEFKTLQKSRRKQRRKELPVPMWRADKRIVRGGSFNNRGQADVVFRSNTRMPLSVEQTVDDLGFRVAKSLVPGLDTTVLLYRNKFNRDSLGDRVLDLPTTRDLRHGLTKSYEQAGMERWNFDGEQIRKYHMLSFVPVTDLEFKTQKELTEAAREATKDKAVGIPIAALFTTVPFRVQQGLKQFASLDADTYVISYRHGGMPRELEIAMHAGKRELKLYKGLRKAEFEKQGKGKTTPAKKSSSRKDDQKKKGKKDDQEKETNWYEVVDHYGIPDEVTKDFSSSKKPAEMLIHPGKLKIPVSKNILLFRKHDGDYIAWAEYRPGIHPRNIASSKPELRIKDEKIEYVGGPRTTVVTKRFEFKIPIRLDEAEAKKSWITPQMLQDVIKNIGTKKPVLAKPKNGSNGSNGK